MLNSPSPLQPVPRRRLTQNESGRAYEAALAIALSDQTGASLVRDPSFNIAEGYLGLAPHAQAESLRASANAAVRFLVQCDSRLSLENNTVFLQSDQRGQVGDVRDILVTNARERIEIGISAKHRHFALKHSRLSRHIDFGREWMGAPASQYYFDGVSPLFLELEQERNRGSLWRDMRNKSQRFYAPILGFFEDEIRRITDSDNLAAGRLVEYLVGRFDFYKIVKVNGVSRVSSFNLHNTLRWGRRLKVPTRLVEIGRVNGSSTTTQAIFDEGWQINFRIHNASSRVEPSLKFDIQLRSSPSSLQYNDVQNLP